jgi:hypothetical protein
VSCDIHHLILTRYLGLFQSLSLSALYLNIPAALTA